LYQQCTTGQTCSNASCQTVTCSTNSQCGTNGLTGSPFCQSGNVYQNYTTWTCNSPGTSQSTCTSSSVPQLITTCTSGQTCTNGACVNSCTSHASQRCVGNAVY
jgi:hypothetical protein